MLAVATSDVQPLPHPIRAVYGELLPRTPLRFLLADDPGAGKTIMAGLYIKELILRGDVRQCLVVAPGGLVEQWQDELFFKFGLRFDLLTSQLIDANVNLNVFETHPLLIARMDRLSRNEQVQAQLAETEWDLVIVDEAHRMGAHYFGGKRKNTVGFAMTVLQRRLASSPEAIYRSLVRRSARLERRKQEIGSGVYADSEPSMDLDVLDADDYNAEEIEELEEELLDEATAAQAIEELNAELLELAELTCVARQVRDAGTDRKWTELSTILQDHAPTTDSSGRPRKLIIFTEHRDTLDYLRGRIGFLLGRPEAVKAIHGGVRRSERRQITEEFTKNHEVQILLATDAAGEGLNLQAAHLMVNYDLPWNPNRIEQRFGRAHRIGQDEVCRLWNLVAANTREGEVFTRLLQKLAQMRDTYGGKVFDVLGEAFTDTPLRTLLRDAIQYGEQPEVKARMHEVIDRSVGDGLAALLEERALASDQLAEADVAALRTTMDEARARRPQPHYIELAFKTAFARLGNH